MEFARQGHWSGLPTPSSGDLLDPGIEPGSPALQVDSLLSEPPGKKPSSKSQGDLQGPLHLGMPDSVREAAHERSSWETIFLGTPSVILSWVTDLSPLLFSPLRLHLHSRVPCLGPAHPLLSVRIDPCEGCWLGSFSQVPLPGCASAWLPPLLRTSMSVLQLQAAATKGSSLHRTPGRCQWGRATL